MSLEIIVFFKTRPFEKYMYNLPSLEIKDKNQVSGTGPLGLLYFVRLECYFLKFISLNFHIIIGEKHFYGVIFLCII